MCETTIRMADTGAGLFGALSEPLTLAPGATGTYIIYALILGIVVAVVLVAVDSVYPFLPMNPVGGPTAAARAGVTFWKPGSTDANTENLIVPPKESPTGLPDIYSVSVQLMIGDSRTPDIGKFRHVLHRGSNPCGITVPTAGSTGHAGIKESDIPPNADPNYTALGLPELMNPGLFLDKFKNDLHVFIHTKGSEEGMEVLWLESQTIEDLPLGVPITVGVVCNGKQLELYVNCRLYSTTLLKGRPYLPSASVNNAWYGRYCAYPFSGIVQNLTLWANALTSSDFIQMCRTASISTSNLPATCPTA